MVLLIVIWLVVLLLGKVVLVIGGVNGIGCGIVQVVFGVGGCVLIGDFDVEVGEVCLVEWQCGEDVVFQCLDIIDEVSVCVFIVVVLQCYGCIDGLVNNVGIVSLYGMLLQDMDWDEWQCWLFLLYGVFLCSKYVLFVLIVSVVGVIINIVLICVW